ncbi:hypothetical protein LSAT2_022329 [Lamellibrachia satsuma]|nr:hypothetical protein LSAT2_022329 [Lamellibrachia satsuma]
MAAFRDQNRGVHGCAPVPYPADTLAQLKSFIKENLPTYDSDEREVTGNQRDTDTFAPATVCTDGPEATLLQAYTVEQPSTERRVFVTTGVITLRDFVAGNDAAPSSDDDSSEPETTIDNTIATTAAVATNPAGVEDVTDAPSNAHQDQSIAAEEGSKRCCTQAKLVLSPPLMSLAAKVNETFVARRHVSISLSESGSDGEVGSHCTHDTTAHNVAQAIQRLEKAYSRDRQRRCELAGNNGGDTNTNNAGHDTGQPHYDDYQRNRSFTAENGVTATQNISSANAGARSGAITGQIGDDRGSTRHRDNTMETVHHNNGHYKHYSETVHHRNNGKIRVTDQSNHRDCEGEHGHRHGNTNVAVHHNHVRQHSRVDNSGGPNGSHGDNSRGAASRHARSRDNLSTDDEAAPYCRPRYTGRRRRQHSNAGDASAARLTVREAAASLERGDFGVRAREGEERERVDGAHRVRRCQSWHDDNDDGYASPDTISSDTSDTSSAPPRPDVAPRTRCRVLSSKFKHGPCPSDARSSPEAATRDVKRRDKPPHLCQPDADDGAAMFRLPHPTPERRTSPTITFHEDAAISDGSVRPRRMPQPPPLRQFGRSTCTAATPGSTNLKRSASMKTNFGYVDRGRVPNFRHMNAILRRHSCRETPATKADGNSLECRIKTLLRQPSEEDTDVKPDRQEDNITGYNLAQPINEGRFYNRPPLQVFSGSTENEYVPADPPRQDYNNRSVDPTTSMPTRAADVFHSGEMFESRENHMRYQPDAEWVMNEVFAAPMEITRMTNSSVVEAQRHLATNDSINVLLCIPRRRVSASAPPIDHVVVIPAARLELLPTAGAVFHNTESGVSRVRPDSPPNRDSPQGGRRLDNTPRHGDAVEAAGTKASPVNDVRGDNVSGPMDDLIRRPRADTTDSSVSHTVNAPKVDRVAQLKGDRSDPSNMRPPASPASKRGKASSGSRVGKRALERVSSVHIKVNNWLNRQDRITTDGHVSDTDSDRTWPLTGHRTADDYEDTTYISPANTRKVLHKVLQMRRNSFRRDTGSHDSWRRRALPGDVVDADCVGAVRSRALLAPPLLVDDRGSPAVHCDRSSPSDVATDGTGSSRNRSLSLPDGATAGTDTLVEPCVVHQRAAPPVGHVSRSAENSRTGTPVSRHDGYIPYGTQSPSPGSDRSRSRRASQPGDVRWRPLVTCATPPLRLASDIGDWLETNRAGRLPSRTHSFQLTNTDVPRQAMGLGHSERLTHQATLPERDFPGRLADTQHALYSSC